MQDLAHENHSMPLARWASNSQWSAIQEMMWIGSRPGVLSFALGLPAAEFFPREKMAEVACRLLAEEPLTLQYGVPYEPLKKHIVTLMAERGVDCTEDEIFLTNGAQQGVNLLARLLLDPGGQIMCEDLIYTGFQQVLQPFSPQVRSVPTDYATGIEVEAVEALLKSGARPAFLYAIPEGHNPTAVSMSKEKRQALVRLAATYNIPIIEDDAYGFLRYEEEELPALRTLYPQGVAYVGSFSKILAPALRVGWIVAPRGVIEKLAIAKEATDINTSTFAQRLISVYWDTEEWRGHLLMLRREYRARRDAMVAALADHLAGQARWWIPSHGLFIWVELHRQIDMRKLLEVAVRTEGVAFIPGQAFAVNPERCTSRAIRLNFSNCNVDRIDEGIGRLARALKRQV